MSDMFAPMAEPFLKWPGGKRALMPEIAARAPARIGHYIELFTGGGAVFFGLRDRIERATLADVNPELVNAYTVIRDCVDDLIDALEVHREQHGDPDYYYRIRAEVPGEPVAQAARFVYLNRTCFNGLHRVNRKGQFNASRGSYANPKIVNAGNLRACADALEGVDIIQGDFQEVMRGMPDAPNAFVYADPPYDGTWTGYAADGFGPADQRRLRDVMLGYVRIGGGVGTAVEQRHRPCSASIPGDVFHPRQGGRAAPHCADGQGPGHGSRTANHWTGANLMERKCEHCKCMVAKGDWMAWVENGDGSVFPWCATCAIAVLDDDGTLNVGNSMPAVAREMARHATALEALSGIYLKMLKDRADAETQS